VVTPCPANGSEFFNLRTEPYQNEDTANVEYTTEFQASLRSVLPQRLPRGKSGKARRLSHIDIWEEERSSNFQASEFRDAGDRRRSVLHQPAQKPVNALPKIKSQRPRRLSSVMEKRAIPDVEPQSIHPTHRNSTCREPACANQTKHPRRRTIYVPSEDTTVMTLHPGAPLSAIARGTPNTQSDTFTRGRQQSPDLGLDLVTVSEEEEDGLIPIIRHKPNKRMSFAVPPKKPLRLSLATTQPRIVKEDIAGLPTGKENIPPLSKKSTIDVKTGLKPIAMEFNQTRPSSKQPKAHLEMRRKISPAARQQESRGKISSKNVHWSSSPAKVKPGRQTTIGHNLSSPAHGSPFRVIKSPPAALRKPLTAKGFDHHSQHSTKPSQGSGSQFKLLAENLVQHELYEDHWLDYQETALTQVINGIFQTTNAAKPSGGTKNMQKDLLAMYQKPEMVVLYKRLKASIEYGALQKSKSTNGTLRDDIGMRKSFLALWLHTYDLSALKIALEVVTGREISFMQRLSGGRLSGEDVEAKDRREKKVLSEFISSILIKNEDSARVPTGFGTIAGIARGQGSAYEQLGLMDWGWRKTMLRSLMLILILDMAKTEGLLENCLFQTNSPFKSSIEVLRQLGKLLLPSFGDITKPLSHLNYQVRTTQTPLQEYKYRIDNIAIDLRNGVLLTRLLEILISSSAHCKQMANDTITIDLPEGDVLTSEPGHLEGGFLTRHLKLPCIGHASKVHNVEIALGVLRGLKGGVYNEVNAADIVNGHRERTLSFLWSLIGRLGLGQLVEWEAVKKEIEKYNSRGVQQTWFEVEADGEKADGNQSIQERKFRQFRQLLASWASLVASSHGLQVANLTSAFADSKVFEAIVDEYLPLTGDQPSTSFNSTNATRTSLASKLVSLGCSHSFVNLFSRPHIPSETFTLLTLAFFASRLIPLSRAHDAAGVIQRFYRLRLARRHISKRVLLMRLAFDCAMVVRTRETVVGAVLTLQKAWRAVLDARVQKLMADVQRFQSVAKGWTVRNAIHRYRYGTGKTERVRGGW
jgi:abnormal spindle-like microcephaly-associated protein